MTHGSSDTAQAQTLTADEIAAMAHVLARRYGAGAAEAALNFAAEHEDIGDISRAGAWRRVARELEFGAPSPTFS